MRVVNGSEEWIGFRLNILGIRVHREHCHLVARDRESWVPVGSPRPLPVYIPRGPVAMESDPLVATARQYEQEHPGSDLFDLLEQTKSFDEALRLP